MSVLGFQLPTSTGTLPAQLKLGSFRLVFMSSVHPLRPQNVYSLVDTKQRDFMTDKPQLLSCNLVGPFGNQLYFLKQIRYFTNEKGECVIKDLSDPYLANVLKSFSDALDSPVLRLQQDEIHGYTVEGLFDLNHIA